MRCVGAPQRIFALIIESQVDNLYEEAGGRSCPEQWRRESFRKKLKCDEFSAEEKDKMQKYLDESQASDRAKIGAKGAPAGEGEMVAAAHGEGICT